MARVVPADRFAHLIEAATKTFVARGYRLTQMADVAEALGVAKGTLYGYVESKEALFDAAVRYADDPALVAPATQPVPTPKSGSTIRYIRERLIAEARELKLANAIGSPSSASPTEFEEVLRDLFRRMARNRCALKLVDRCAADHPELAAVWFDEGRWGHVDLIGRYLERGIAQRQLRAVPNVSLAARMLLETVALWAIHMPWDPSPRPYLDAEVENAVVDMLVQAFMTGSR